MCSHLFDLLLQYGGMLFLTMTTRRWLKEGGLPSTALWSPDTLNSACSGGRTGRPSLRGLSSVWKTMEQHWSSSPSITATQESTWLRLRMSTPRKSLVLAKSTLPSWTEYVSQPFKNYCCIVCTRGCSYYTATTCTCVYTSTYIHSWDEGYSYIAEKCFHQTINSIQHPSFPLGSPQEKFSSMRW